MIIRIQKRADPFARVPKVMLNDKRLSWKAKGILSYLLSKPNNWTVQSHDIFNHGTDGRDAIQAAFKELRDCGYAVLGRERNDDGTLSGTFWTVSDSPQPTENLKTRLTVKPSDGKASTTKNDKSTKNDLAPYGTPEFEAVWTEWENHRKHKRQSLTPEAIKRQFSKLAAMGEARAIKAINFSIEQGYTGIFEEQSNGQNQHNRTNSNRGNRSIGTRNEGKSSEYRGIGQVTGNP